MSSDLPYLNTHKSMVEKDLTIDGKFRVHREIGDGLQSRVFLVSPFERESLKHAPHSTFSDVTSGSEISTDQ